MNGEGRTVDVVVPVYRGMRDTRRCLESVLAARCQTRFELVVVDDCSPEPEISAFLDRLAESGWITLLRNLRNTGFVGAVNRGMRLHPERDVVLLNSDAEVANDWLDRLAACAASAPDIATVTPFSNNATICSYPFDGWTGEVPGTLGLAGLDRLFAATHAGVSADLPTAVGFCMFIRRACLDRIGLFDEQRFGRGYGEENDFSLRAAKAGWRNVLCADTFVYHRGGVSFGPGRDELMRNAEQALLQVHPDYNERVAVFVAADPLDGLRKDIDRARAASGADELAALRAEKAWGGDCRVRYVGWRSENDESDGWRPHERHGKPVILHLSHSWGGGVERWVRDFAFADERGWNLVLRSRTGRNAAGVRLELVDVLAGDEPLLAWDLPQPIRTTEIAHETYRQILDQILDGFCVEAVIASSLIGHSLEALATGRPTVVVLHDLYPFCPALFGWFDGECQSCDSAALRRCLTSNPLNLFWSHDDVAVWASLRDAFAEKLGADTVQIAAPGDAVHARYSTLFPVLRDKPWSLIPHGLGRVPPQQPAGDSIERPVGDGRRLRVLIPGRMSLHKGLHLFEQILPSIAACAEVLLLGCGDFGKPFADLEHVRIVPDYANAELAAQVAEFRPDCALLLSVLPETFSYTLSEMQALGVPVLATELGAFAERIEHGTTGLLVEPAADAIIATLNGLSRDRSALERVRANLLNSPVRIAARMVEDYRALIAQTPTQTLRRGAAALIVTEFAGAAVKWRVRAQALMEARGDTSRREADSCARIADLEAERDRLVAALAVANAGVVRLESQVAGLEAHRDALLGSTSWRLTRPLRAARRAFGRGGETLPARGAGGGKIPDHLPVPLPVAAGHVEAVGALPATRFPAPVTAEMRDVERLRRRDALGLPDSARIIAGMGAPAAQSGLLRFARVAMDFSAQRNGCYFVWIGGQDPAWLRAHRDEIGVPVALRRLFLVADDNFEAWLLAADAYLGCGEPDGHDFGALEALALGVPVAVESRDSLPDDLRQSPIVGGPDVAEGGDALPRLALWVEGAFVPRDAAARFVRQHCEKPRPVQNLVTVSRC